MKFCSHCGSDEVEQKVPQGDNRLRYCCLQCEAIFYENPKIVTGCIAQWNNNILLCKRAIQPRLGTWTLPAGFMENHETIQEAAARETYEEATAKISNLHLYTIYNLPHISQVYIIFRGDVEDGLASPGEESMETKFVAEQDIPWDDLAFPIIKESLELYFADRKRGQFSLYTGEIRRMPDRNIQIIRY